MREQATDNQWADNNTTAFNWELQCKDLQARIHDLNEQLVRCQQQASLSQFVAGMAHEINTPIGVAMTALSFFQDISEKIQKKYETQTFSRKDFEEFLRSSQETLSIMAKNMARAAHMIASFKNISVDQYGEAPRDIEVKSYIDEVILMLRPVLKRSSHQVVCDVAPHWIIYSYPGALVQVVTNLVMNSLMHAFEGIEKGHIQIQIYPERSPVSVVGSDTFPMPPEQVCMVYQDDGVGMTPEVLERLFEPLFTTKKGRGGTGLGMSIIQSIVRNQLHGDLQVTSSPGQGMQVRIRFPAHVP